VSFPSVSVGNPGLWKLNFEKTTERMRNGFTKDTKKSSDHRRHRDTKSVGRWLACDHKTQDTVTQEGTQRTQRHEPGLKTNT
jgi:hypothetical protein